MARGRKRKDASQAAVSGSGVGSVGGSGRSASAIIAPGGGTASDIAKLSHQLSLPTEAVTAIMNCQGQGVRSSRRSTANAEATAVNPAMMSNVWGDFLNEEMTSSSAAPAATSASALTSASAPSAAASNAEPAKAKSTPAATASSSSNHSDPRNYILPIQPRMRITTSTSSKTKSKNKANDEDEDDPSFHLIPTPGLLAQTGTLDSSLPGRTKSASDSNPQDLECPTLIFPSVFNVKIAHIAASPTSCHSVAITIHGVAYGWGRNENGQLGLGNCSAVVPTPTVLTVPSEDEKITFVGAGVGKYHTILVGNNGMAYASGNNKVGQLGINHSVEQIDKFRKCVVAGAVSATSSAGAGKKKKGKGDEGGDEDDGGDEEGGVGSVKIVQVSCGENISALLSSAGHLYTSGTSEFGLLGNGETGEYFVSANKLAYANCSKFVRRSNFVQSENDAAVEQGGSGAGRMMTVGVDSAGKVKLVPLKNASKIRLGNISCGKSHIIAIEAASSPDNSTTPIPRVFTWGCGDYGCLGHAVQADEYTPRLVGAMRGPLFASNPPVAAVAGAHCCLVRTKNGHVYYWGKHRNVGEATMRPTLVDALANNGHCVKAVGAGAMTVFCSTKNGVTVSWGQGSYGELGYGKGENKSSAKPKFVNGLDSCLVTDVACGMGHTLFLIRDEDEEDAKALKKVPKIDESDLAKFIDEVKSKKVSGVADVGEEDASEPSKKKSRGKGKKS